VDPANRVARNDPAITGEGAAAGWRRKGSLLRVNHNART